MKQADYGDMPNLPQELKRKGVNIQDELHTDVPKRSGETRKVRHRIKALLREILINKNKR